MVGLLRISLRLTFLINFPNCSTQICNTKNPQMNKFLKILYVSNYVTLLETSMMNIKLKGF